MQEFEFQKTEDGSLGLYNFDVQDIYHARQGAYSEARDKFAVPAINHLIDINQANEINLLDICYGIGYNSIAFIQNISNEKFLSNINKINITLLEYNKSLIILSPFIKCNNYNFFIRLRLLQFIKKYFTKSEIEDEIRRYKEFIDDTIYRRYFKPFKFSRGKLLSLSIKEGFLHNTYYNYISNRHKMGLKLNNIKKIHLTIKFGDARKSIFDVKPSQNIVFLDAFDVKKLPTLWSCEFFKAIYSKIHENGMLFTYSHAATVRSAMNEANFYIGLNNNIGTVCAKNKNFIKYNLSEYDLGLLKTNAGIPYHDYNLSMNSDELTQDRLRRVKLENRESSTHYAKTHQK